MVFQGDNGLVGGHGIKGLKGEMVGTDVGVVCRLKLKYRYKCYDRCIGIDLIGILEGVCTEQQQQQQI